MKFTEFEKIMYSQGAITLAQIARMLDTTPQAVSNWKARDQVPYHIVAKYKSGVVSNNPNVSSENKLNVSKEDNLVISDIFLILAEQFKVILIVPFITIFFVLTYVMHIQEPMYKSSATILVGNDQGNSGGLSGIASQFGVNLQQGRSTIDLSSPSLLPELIASRTFAERILNKKIYSEKDGKDKLLINILSSEHDLSDSIENQNILIQKAIIVFQGMVSLNADGTFSVLTVNAKSPQFARDLNNVVLNELEALNKFYKTKTINEKTIFIENRISTVEKDLVASEHKLKSFREQNRQISTPSLQLELERINRDVEIQKGIFLTLKQELELAKIEEIQESNVIQVIDEPRVPLSPYNKNIKLNVLIASVFGLIFGLVGGLIRGYFQNSNIDERRKLRRIKNFLNKKAKDVMVDRRMSGLISLTMLIGLPFYLSYESSNPVYFGRYSFTLLIFNIVYLVVFIFSMFLFIYRSKKI